VGRATELPTGTLTFLFTDIEGSTRLLHELGPSYDAALAEHRKVLRATFERHNGQELNTEGDAFFVAFERAADAVAAAVAFQRDLGAHAWSHEPIRVRAGMHTGDARIVDEDLVGLAIHEAARIASAAHGGQVLVSATTAALARHDAPDGVSFADIGRYRLKDIPGDAQLFELSHPDLPAFGRARLAAVRPNNLPRPGASLIARDDDVAELVGLCAKADVVTVAGTAGAGKTAIAIALGNALLDDCADGVWFVDLTAVPDAVALWEGLADAIGVEVDADGSPRAATLQALAQAKAAVIVDNCEHVLDIAGEVLDALRVAGPSLTLIATSREPLEIPGETVWRVPELDEGGAQQLFVDRARQVNASFEPDAAALDAVRRICDRLDRLPLAIELAAGRTRMMSVTEIDERLADRFRLLTGGARANARQQTLRAAIDWSYDHLGDDEQLLLRRLSVFIGSFTFDAIEGVCDFDHALKLDSFDVVGALVNRSLLKVEYVDGRTRYRLLESIRLYARDELAISGEADRLLLSHLTWFAGWAEQIESRLSSGADAAVLTEVVQLEIENVRRALRRAADVDPAMGLRLAVALAPYWERRGFVEGYDAIAGFLHAAPLPTEGRARALLALGRLARRKGATEDELERLTEAFSIEAASPRWRGEIANSLGLAYGPADASRAMELIARAVDLFAEGVRPGRQASALHDLAVCEFNSGEGDAAYAHLLEAADLAARSGDDLVAATVLGTLALVDNYSGNPESAYERLAQVMDIAERLNNLETLVRAHTIGAQIDAFNGKLVDAAAHNQRITEFFDVASVSLEMRNQVRLELASLLMAVGDYEQARKILETELAALAPEATTTTVLTLSSLGLVELYAGRFDAALRVYGEAIALAAATGFDGLADEVAMDRVATLVARGDLGDARRTLDELLARNPELCTTTVVALLLAEDRADEARAAFLAWLEANPAATPLSLASPLEMAAHVLARAADPEAAAVVLGAELAAYRGLDLAEGAPARRRREATTSRLRDRLGAAAFDAAVARGAAMPIEEAFAYACDALRTTAN
jgi:predicted ATPase/class 3 adenylate cyclase